MDQKIPIGIGLVATIAATAAWLMPPTEPKAMAATDWRAQARVRSAAGTQPLPSATESAIQTAALSPTAPLADAIAAQARASVRDAGLAMARQAGLVVQRSGERAVETLTDDRDDAPPPAVRPQSPPRAQPAAMMIDSAEARYRSGYTWARDNGVEDPRECRPWRDDPASEGCLDYLDDNARGDGGGW